MKLYERKMVQRVYEALNKVPGAHIGGSTQSTTVKGAVSFGYDIGKVRELLSDALLVLMDGSIADADRQSEFDRAMAPVDEFIAKRQARDWSATL